MGSKVRPPPEPAALPRLTTAHVLAWGSLGLRVDDALREHVDVPGTLDDLTEALCDPAGRVPTASELFELARFVCQVRRGEALALRERLDYAATPAAQAASAALLGAWLMHHADVPAYRRNR